MRAKNLEELINFFRYDHHLEPTQHHFFVNIFGKELDKFANEVALSLPNQMFFITGQSGNGKTSMLKNLQAHYPNILKGFSFLYLEGRDLFNLENINIQDVIYTIAKKLMPTEPIEKNIDIKTLNFLINRYKKEVLKDKKLVLVIDDFEKIVIEDINKKDNATYRFLFKDIPTLKDLDAIKLITFPFHLKSKAITEDAIFRDFIIHLDSFGRIDIEKIKEVVLKRLENKELIEDMEFLISYSGANMRQLIQIVYQAGINSKSYGGAKIDKDDIKEAIITLRKDFSNFVEKELDFYRFIQKNHNIDPTNKKHQKLLPLTLRNRTIFAYLFNGNYYYGVNPVIVELLEGRRKPKFI